MAINAARLPRSIVTVGGSAGGFEALRRILARLPANFPATIAVALHRAPNFESRLSWLLQRCGALPVSEPHDGTPCEPSHVYLAPADHHLMIEQGRFRVVRSPKVHYTRPAVDPLFQSAASAYGREVIGVLLSGGGDDGVSGLIRIKAAGGVTLVQHPDEAAHPWMPTNAIVYDQVEGVLPVDELASALITLVGGGALAAPVLGRPGGIRRAPPARA